VPPLLSLANAASTVFLVIPQWCLWRIKSASGEVRNLRLIGGVSGGLTLLVLGVSTGLPFVASPQVTVRGIVTGFHQVKQYRNSDFKFRINGDDPELRAGYFDRGFYFGDPLVSNGDTVELVYLSWTNQVMRIREIDGHYPGWAFEEGQRKIGPGLLVLMGILIIFSSVREKLTDLAARPDRTPSTDLTSGPK
jgi:hypothetical protein